MFHSVKRRWKLLAPFIGIVSLSAYDVEVRVPALDAHYLPIIQSLWEKCPSSMKIEVIKNTTFWEKITGSGGPKIQPYSSLLQKIPWQLGSFVFNGSMCSYLAIAYFFYRVYRVVTKINSFLSWWNGTSQETTLIEDVERMFVRTVKKDSFYDAKAELFYEECVLLEAYLYIEETLSSLHIKWMFPYSNVLEKQKIKNILASLKMISSRSKNHSYNPTRIILPNERECATLI